MINKKTISIFVPHVGCPNDCVFCNQRRITGQTEPVCGTDVKLIIEEQLKTIKADVVELAFFGGSFTAIETKRQLELLEAVKPYIELGKIDYIRVSTRPDAIDDKCLTLLKKFNVKIIELGVQSLDKNVLIASNRGHDASCVFVASNLIKSYGFELGLQMMVGLPSDNRATVIKTAYEFVNIMPQYVRIYPVLVIKDTALEEQLKLGYYTPIGLEETIDIVSDLIAIFELNGIKIIRIGLQNSDNISLDNSVLAGPFHPSLGELCYSRLYRRLLECEFENLKLKNQNIIIEVDEKSISKFVGNNKANVLYFASKGINLKVKGNKSEFWKILYENKKITLDYFNMLSKLSISKEE